MTTKVKVLVWEDETHKVTYKKFHIEGKPIKIGDFILKEIIEEEVDAEQWESFKISQK